MAKEKILLSDDELSVLCRQLALLCGTGMPTADGVGILLGDVKAGGREEKLLRQIRDELERGASLSEAAAHTGAFPAYMEKMLAIGELSGRSEQVLGALSDFYARQAETNRTLRRAVTYPAVMGVLVAAVFFVLIARVLPVFEQVFAQMGAAGGIFSAGSVWRAVAVAVIGLLAALSVLLLLLFRLRAAAPLRKKLFSGGATARALARSRFASAMNLMLSSGLPLDQALENTGELLCDSPLSEPIARCRSALAEGSTFVRAVESAGLLSGLDAGLLTVGFTAGATEQAMEQVSVRCQQEADGRMARLLSLFEYGLVLVLCGGVGLLLLSVMLPLLGVLSTLGG